LTRKTHHNYFFLVTILCLLTSIFSNSHAQNSTRFSVTEVTATQLENNKLQLLSKFQLSLSATAYDAINHGVPIDIVIHFANPRDRFWGTQYQTLGKTSFRLTRHALSNNYQLENISNLKIDQFITIDEALKHITTFQINTFEVTNSKNIAVRVFLDIFNLPPQIRASAFFSGRWRHDSFWTIWEIS